MSPTKRTPSRSNKSSSNRSSMAQRGRVTRGRPAGKTTRKSASQNKRRSAQIVERQPMFWESISPERKLDILGIILALLGLLTLLSMFSRSQGTITFAWVQFLKQAAGWGAFILPVSLLGFGAWLLFRHLERFPLLSAERFFGIFLLLVNFLGWLNLFAEGIWEPARAGSGGGYIGGAVEWLLVRLAGNAGAVVILITWLILAVIITLDISVTDLIRSIRRGRLPEANADNYPSSYGRNQESADRNAAKEQLELPPTFQPLRPIKGLPSSSGSTIEK